MKISKRQLKRIIREEMDYGAYTVNHAIELIQSELDSWKAETLEGQEIKAHSSENLGIGQYAR